MGKLENLLSFDDFDKSWKSKDQKSTKRTEVGLDILNENLYMKVMDQTSKDWKKNVDEFISDLMKQIRPAHHAANQVKDINVTDKSATFVIRGRKHRVNKDEGSITLWRTKATAYRVKETDEAGRVREVKGKAGKRKTREDIEVTIPISKAEATTMYNALKERFED